MIGSSLKSVPRRIREFFLLTEAERRVTALSASQRTNLRICHDAAMRRLRAAEDLCGVSQPAVALTLSRQGAFFLAAAYLASKRQTFDTSSLTLRSALDELNAVLTEDGCRVPPQFEAVRRLAAADDPLEFDRLPARETRRLAEELELVTAWLGRLVDPRSPRELRFVRIVRIAIASIALVTLLVVAAVWLFSPPNLALHKKVAASSVAWDTVPEGAVDGKKDGRFGFHSAIEDSPWLSIDLGRGHLVTRIKVYGRGDGTYDQSIPLALEVSDDGSSYHQIAERTEPFSELGPWVIKPEALTTRFIRLRTERRSVLVLGEVEVNGRVPK